MRGTKPNTPPQQDLGCDSHGSLMFMLGEIKRSTDMIPDMLTRIEKLERWRSYLRGSWLVISIVSAFLGSGITFWGARYLFG